MFAGKSIIITGGTGSFGNAVLNRFLETDIEKNRFFSRDEKKQDDMRNDFLERMPEVDETLLTNEECGNAIDMGEFCWVPADQRDLNYSNLYKKGRFERNMLTEFDSNNTELLGVDQVKEKFLTLRYIRDELARMECRS